MDPVQRKSDAYQTSPHLQWQREAKVQKMDFLGVLHGLAMFCQFYGETEASYAAMTGVRVEIVLTTGNLDMFFNQKASLRFQVLKKVALVSMNCVES